MKVFIPCEKEGNPFFDEIMTYSKHEFYFEDYTDFDASYEVVLIHWPEKIFNWKEPSIGELKKLTNQISIWKKHAKIIYTVHNIERHYGMTSQFTALYNLIQDNCDAMVHFGKYSRDIFEINFPEIIHQVIPHPLYEKSFHQYRKKEARERLGVHQDALVIIAPGRIRNKHERDMTLKAFKNLTNRNKVLMSTNMLSFKFPWEFKGRTRLKAIFDVKKYYENNYIPYKYGRPKYFFNYLYLNSDEFSLMMSAADVVFIPRITLLNSGNVYLGLTYRKIIVGPRIGNVKEILTAFGFFSFDPNDFSSISKALHESVELFRLSQYRYNEEKLNMFKPKVIARQWDNLFEEL